MIIYVYFEMIRILIIIIMMHYTWALNYSEYISSMIYNRGKHYGGGDEQGL